MLSAKNAFGWRWKFAELYWFLVKFCWANILLCNLRKRWHQIERIDEMTRANHFERSFQKGDLKRNVPCTAPNVYALAYRNRLNRIEMMAIQQ